MSWANLKIGCTPTPQVLQLVGAKAALPLPLQHGTGLHNPAFDGGSLLRHVLLQVFNPPPPTAFPASEACAVARGPSAKHVSMAVAECVHPKAWQLLASMKEYDEALATIL